MGSTEELPGFNTIGLLVHCSLHEPKENCLPQYFIDVNPNTLNLDKDPEFWPNLDQDFESKIFKQFSLKIFLNNFKKIMSPEEFFLSDETSV